MTLRTLAVGIAGGLIGLCLGLTLIGTAFAQKEAGAAPEAVQLGRIGRYQGAVSYTHFCLFDTVTGQAWMARSGENWQPAIQPIKP
jgi:hypothetical protein